MHRILPGSGTGGSSFTALAAYFTAFGLLAASAAALRTAGRRGEQVLHAARQAGVGGVKIDVGVADGDRGPRRRSAFVSWPVASK